MVFSYSDKLKVLAIVRIFETSRPLGNYAALAILNDGAGISYGSSQFTHRSGSLEAVLKRYLANGGEVGLTVIESRLPQLALTDRRSIERLAADADFKQALRNASTTKAMRAAQDFVAFERYLQPAIAACAGSRFTLPLSLAVVFDSMTHGSWDKIRDRVTVSRVSYKDDIAFEKAWITAYVRCRNAWLQSVPRLKSTSKRPQFFLSQIALGKWHLQLPIRVTGVWLKDDLLQLSTVEHLQNLQDSAESQPISANNRMPLQTVPAEIQPSISSKIKLDEIRDKVNRVADVYDEVEEIVQTVVKRNDAAKSLWTTVAGSLWQTIWAVVSFFVGLPREVWLVVAVIVAALIFFYLYRQLELGKIRETQQ